MKISTVFTAAFLAVAMVATTSYAEAQPTKDMLTIQLKDGNVVIQLLPKVAPKAVKRLETLAEKGAYDNVAFHRVIAGFMAQTGDVQYGDMKDGYDPQLVGTGGSKLPDLPAEFSSVPFKRGTVGMARAQDPNSANSQFFIMLADGDFLDGKYTVVGKVIKGMQYVDNIKKGDKANNGAVTDPDRMIKVTVGK
ncbi:MAG TPA: peptidylprolyl isomerase [Pararhizobium sp.]|nr:peptidylprolyl isomerase [Pararhizobium sp.]